MKITIIYDNTTRDRRLGADWGFACLVETGDRKILFDTGANGFMLLNNMKYLDIAPAAITDIFISHDHWDHTGGLPEILAIRRVPCFIPDVFSPAVDLPAVVVGQQPQELHENIWSTGTLAGIEQSLVVRQVDRTVVVTGCSHPGVETILAVAGTIGRVSGLIGGLHDFNNIEALTNLELICPTHCTHRIESIRQRYPDCCVQGGAGSVIDL